MSEKLTRMEVMAHVGKKSSGEKTTLDIMREACARLENRTPRVMDKLPVPPEPALTPAPTSATPPAEVDEPDMDNFIPAQVDDGIPVPVKCGSLISAKRVDFMLKMKEGQSFRVPLNLVERFLGLGRKRSELRGTRWVYRTENELWGRIWRMKAKSDEQQH